jgi:hypothetical protein
MTVDGDTYRLAVLFGREYDFTIPELDRLAQFIQAKINGEVEMILKERTP